MRRSFRHQVRGVYTVVRLTIPGQSGMALPAARYPVCRQGGFGPNLSLECFPAAGISVAISDGVDRDVTRPT